MPTWIFARAHGACALVVLLSICINPLIGAADGDERSFVIKDDVFLKDGEPLQIISGSIHYQRIHPAYWRDRLQRVKALGLNAVQFYVPWNFHERRPGQYTWDGFADMDGFLRLCAEEGLLVLIRPGPYICGEWDFGGLPWWLLSSSVTGGGRMKLRSADPDYLYHVDRWWRVLLPRLLPYLYRNGGPIILVQVENEYGFCENSPDAAYLTFLRDLASQLLGPETLLYTTDPPYVAEKGSLWGKQVYSVVDFGPGTDLDYAFTAQAQMNLLGQSPPFCSEY